MWSKGPKNHQKSQKKTIFHIFWALEPYHPNIELNFSFNQICLFFGTYIVECPKDNIIFHRASGVEYGVIFGLQRPQKIIKNKRKGYFFTYLGH